MSNIKRRVKWNKHGVSEIIGNILILGITVTLFSSIMWFVTAMPTPQEHAYADMTSNVNMGYSPSTGGWASISVTHKGGQELKNDATGIYIWVNDTTLLKYKIANSAPSIGTSWTAGEVWRINITSATFPVGKDPSKARIALMITDTVKNSEVYAVTLNGGGALINPVSPIIGARGTTPSPTYAGDSFFYYATVTDPNNDLDKNSIYLDASSIDPSWASLKMTDSNNDGVFTAASPAIADLNWNGRIVIVSASDLGGHSVIGRITLSILYKGGGGAGTQYGPYYNYSSYFVNGTYPPDATGGESGGSGGVAGTTFYYIRHLPDMVITRNFDVGDQVMIEIYSDALKNLALQNDFILYHPLTGNQLTPPTATDAFKYGGIYGTFHRYVFNFTVPSVGLIYPIQLKLKDNTGTVTNIVDQINVGGATYPALMTYKLDLAGNYVSSKDFNHTDRVYIKMITKDVDPTLTTVSVGTMEISDYTGRYIIKATPPTASAYPAVPNYVAPISSVYKTGTTSSIRLADNNQLSTTKYTIYLDLKDAYQGWWLPRTNAYTMRLSLLSDTGPATGEIYYSQTLQINITAPLTTTDIVASIGSGSYTWSSTGASWTNNKLAWFSNAEGSGQWKKTTIADPTYNGPLAMFLSDINNDGYNDLVVGYQDSSVSIAVYYNQKADGSTWSESPTLICPAFDANPGLQAANTNDKGLANEDVSVYKTASGKRFYGDSGDYLQNELVFSMAAGDFDSDGDQDVVASFTHVVTYTTSTSRGGADWDNSRPMFFNRGIYVFWNEGSWIKQQLYGTNTYTNADTNPAASGVDTADFNQDGYPDIVGVYEDGSTRVWLNRYMESTGDKRAGAFGTAASLITLAPTVAGTNPWRWDILSQSSWPYNYAFAKVVAEQIGYGNYPDIVRTSTASNTVSVFYTTPTTATQNIFNPFNQYGLATVTGTIGNLNANDSKWENLTEAYLNYPIDKAIPTAKGVTDDTGQLLSSLSSNDGSTYQVDPSKRMYLTAFGTDASYAGKIVASAWLTVKYSSDSNYDGTQSLQISTDEGATTTTTNITPLSNEDNKISWYNLLANGVNTYSKLSSLDVSFWSNAIVGHGSVRFDYLWLQVEFVEARAVDWTWELNNTITSPLHELTVVGKVLATGEAFQLMYSPDNTNWFNLTQITSTTQMTWIFELDHTTNSKYFLRVVDLNRGAAEQPSGDMVNNTICLNWIQLRNFMPQVTWLATDKVDIAPIAGLGSGVTEERVTCIAVGDLGKYTSDYRADGWPDIVVGTSKVGGGDETHSVYILVQTGEKSFTAVPITTHNLATMVTSNSLYDIANINLGDLNGDNNLDIVFTVGFSPGQSTSTPAATLWMIENEPLPGAWQFNDQPVNVLGANQAAINAITGNVDLTILMPFLGVLGILAAEAITRKRKK
jgi:hypothetical protein